MFLHLGNDVTLSYGELMGIIAISKIEKGSLLDGLLERLIKTEKPYYIGQGPFRSFVIAVDNRIYCSPIDAKTLSNRLQSQDKNFFNLTEARNGKKGRKVYRKSKKSCQTNKAV
ncbi:hypothetical protein K8S19_03545 [bacterium]|nr:hypothetical protein [bacterium]